MILSWNGFTGREVVLDLLTFIPIGPFEGVPLETLLSLLF
jgi:hypothetical protein